MRNALGFDKGAVGVQSLRRLVECFVIITKQNLAKPYGIMSLFEKKHFLLIDMGGDIFLNNI
ncbi:hypothetical protein [Pseudescherichia sp.]|uniref:hypothetical protein n=1 Tax=Pseudescherichia sp. TaxID=2055881 RepID=UPI0028A05679|nr:hypothetical protein [Pseudescherichia sp.]